MKFSIIIPAFNEEAYLPSTSGSIRDATAHLRKCDIESEVSTDSVYC